MKIFLFHAGDLTVTPRLDSGMNMCQGTSGPEPKPVDARGDDAEGQDDDPLNGKEDKTSGADLRALESDLREYQFSEDNEIEEVDGPLVLMTLSLFMSPTKKAPASLSPAAPVYLALDSQMRDMQKLLYESPSRRRIDETMRVSFLGTMPEEKGERYQRELERQTGVTWNRMASMERTWDVIRSYGTQSVMKVILNQPIMRKVLEKMMCPTESDSLIESVTEDSADENTITKRQPVKRAKKGLKRLKIVNSRVIKSKASTVVTSLANSHVPMKMNKEIVQRRVEEKKRT